MLIVCDKNVMKWGVVVGHNTSLFKNWAHICPHAKQNKAVILSVWKCLPSTLCWHIWLAKNKCILKEKKPISGTILAKTQAQIVEMINAKSMPPPDQTNWKHAKKIWYNKIPLNGLARNYMSSQLVLQVSPLVNTKTIEIKDR